MRKHTDASIHHSVNGRRSILRLAVLALLIPALGQTHIVQSQDLHPGSPVIHDAPHASQSVDADASLSTRMTPSAARAGLVVDTTDRAAVIAAYQATTRAATAVSWTGSQISCNPGTTPQSQRDAILDRINYYRAMAGVPAAVTFSADLNERAQRAALMMSANNSLSHAPPSSWRCYSAEGANAAGNSNLLLGGAGPSGIDLYMHDFGANNAAVGHRRWLLYPQTQVMGTGDVAAASGYRAANALWVFDNTNMWGPRPATRDGFVAWPPPGYVPHMLIYGRWSFSYPGANFSAASITVRRNGVTLPVQLEPITNGFGENTIVWRTNGMSDSAVWPMPASDEPLEVSISNVVIGGAARSFQYTVIAIDPVNRNVAPTAIGASSNSISEDLATGEVAAVLTARDPDPGDVHTFALTAGAGDAHNALFRISGANLIVNGSIDFETVPVLSVRVSATDRAGAKVTQIVTFAVSDVDEAPSFGVTQLRVTSGAFEQRIVAADPEGGTVSVALVSAPAGLDVIINGPSVTLRGDTSALTFPARVTLRLTDMHGVSTDVTLTISYVRGLVALPFVRR